MGGYKDTIVGYEKDKEFIDRDPEIEKIFAQQLSTRGDEDVKAQEILDILKDEGKIKTDAESEKNTAEREKTWLDEYAKIREISKDEIKTILGRCRGNNDDGNALKSGEEVWKKLQRRAKGKEEFTHGDHKDLLRLCIIFKLNFNEAVFRLAEARQCLGVYDETDNVIRECLFSGEYDMERVDEKLKGKGLEPLFGNKKAESSEENWLDMYLKERRMELKEVKMRLGGVSPLFDGEETEETQAAVDRGNDIWNELHKKANGSKPFTEKDHAVLLKLCVIFGLDYYNAWVFLKRADKGLAVTNTMDRIIELCLKKGLYNEGLIDQIMVKCGQERMFYKGRTDERDVGDPYKKMTMERARKFVPKRMRIDLELLR